MIYGLKIRNPIAWNFSLGGNNIVVDSVVIQAKSNSSVRNNFTFLNFWPF